MILKKHILLALVFCSITLIGQISSIQKPLLINCWTESREENKKGSEINTYRPCDFKTFPSARFRFKVELNDDGSCNYLHLASNDAHYMTTGNWSFNEQTNYLEIWDQKGDLIKKFKILSLQKELMEVLEERI